MISTLLSSLGISTVTQSLGQAFATIKHPATEKAASALQEVEALLQDKEIALGIQKTLIDFVQQDQSHEQALMAQIQQSLQKEMTLADAYVRRWRPTFGYAVALSWTMTMASVSYALIYTPEQAPALLNGLMNISALWGIALAVLGVSVVKRSQDKAL
jgi:hypothetical protein